MATTIGVTKAMTSLTIAEEFLNLRQADDPAFFSEWTLGKSTLSKLDQEFLDRLQRRYRYYQAEGAITESTVNLILVSPLLEYLGLCDPPYKVRGEKYVRIEIEDQDQILDGLIDFLVVRDSFWLVLLECKRYGFSPFQALPQTLAYMAKNLNGPTFGLITTGEDYLFVKLDRAQNLYDISDKFTLSTRQGNELYQVVQILHQLIATEIVDS
jgi:predicted type IV restriction endonuclease